MEPQKVQVEDMFQLIGELSIQLRLAHKAIEGLKQRISFLEQRQDKGRDDGMSGESGV